MVILSAMVRASDLGRELVEKIGVRARVDLAPEELGGGAHRDAGHLTPQGFARARGLELDLLLRGRNQARGFAARGALGLLHQIAGAVLRLLDDVVGALARLAHDGVGLVARLGELLLALFGGRKSLCDLARALLHRVQDVRPDVPHRAEDQHSEHEHLHDEREIDVHGPYLLPRAVSARATVRRAQRIHEGIREREEQREADADHRHRVEQARDQEHLYAQHRQQLRLARRAFDETPAQKAEADGGAEGPHAEDDADGQHGHGLDVCNVFHSTLLKDTEYEKPLYRRAPSLSVMLVRHRQIDDRQHHEYDSLNRDDQDMKNRPQQSKNKLGDESEPTAYGGESAEPV